MIKEIKFLFIVIFYFIIIVIELLKIFSMKIILNIILNK